MPVNSQNPIVWLDFWPHLPLYVYKPNMHQADPTNAPNKPWIVAYKEQEVYISEMIHAPQHRHKLRTSNWTPSVYQTPMSSY